MDLGIRGITDPVEIGRGGYAVVYRAFQPGFERYVAIKVLYVPAVGESTRAAFRRECTAIGRLSGRPNILTVHDAGLTDAGKPYLVMEYLGRGSLEDHLVEHGPLDWYEAAGIGIKLSRALDHAHRAGILHRDLKPANVLMSDEGEPQLADFGIARIADATRTTKSGFSGTPAHAAPEMWDRRPLTTAVDVYSLASTIYNLITGHPPFEEDPEDSILVVVARVASAPVPDLRPQGVPDAMCQAIEQAMAKNPADRPSPALFGARLQAAQADAGAKGRVVARPAEPEAQKTPPPGPEVTTVPEPVVTATTEPEPPSPPPGPVVTTVPEPPSPPPGPVVTGPGDPVAPKTAPPGPVVTTVPEPVVTTTAEPEPPSPPPAPVTTTGEPETPSPPRPLVTTTVEGEAPKPPEPVLAAAAPEEDAPTSPQPIVWAALGLVVPVVTTPPAPAAPSPPPPAAVRARPSDPGPLSPPPPRYRRPRVMVASSAVVAAINLVIAVLIITTPPKSSLAVPNVEGKSQSEAQATLRSLKLRSVVRREFNDLEAELVATQVPVTGRLNEGQAVTLIVSKGPRPVDIPDLAAVTSEQDAFNTLLNAGLQPGIVYRREDPRALAGQVLDWSLKGTRQPRGTAVDITFSTGPAGATSAAPQSPLMLSQPGAVGEGRYITDAFVPRVTVTLNPGWVVDTAGPDRVSLSRADRPSSRVSFVRVHRVYNPVSPNNERQQLATTDDALNSVQDIRDLQGDLAEFLATHPNRLPGLGGIRSTTRAGRSGSEVDAQFRPYAYNGCRSVTNMCAPIFQLYDEAGRTSSFPFVGTEVARFEIFRIVSGAHLVMVTSALDIDFKNFVSEARSLLNVEQFEFTDRIATVRVRSSTNPSEENALVTLTADAGPVCSVGRVLFSTAAPDSLMPLGSAELVNGTAMLVVTFQGQGGRARVVAEYEGDCARGVSAPLFQRVT